LEAVRKADLLEDKKIKAIALINWAAEDAAFDGMLSERLYQDAKDIAGKVCSPDVDFLVERLRQRLDKRAQEVH
jgi:hypothetical protein